MPRGLDSSPQGHALRLSVAVSVLCLCAFGLLTAAVVSNHADGLDSRVVLWVGDHRSSAATAVMKAVTWLGSTVLLYPAVIVIGAVLWWRQRDLRPGAALAGALIGAVVLYGAIKPIVGRARPPEELAVGTYPGWAFPSGHATQAIAFYGMLAFILSYGRGTRVWVAAAAAVTLMVGASRIYLGAHWLTDVLGGFAIGGSWLSLMIAVLLLANRGGSRG